MNTFLLLIIAIHLYFSVKKPLYGLCSLLAIKILIPDIARTPFVPLSINSFCSIITFASYFLYLLAGKESVRYLKNPLVAFLLIYFLFSFVVFILTDYTPKSTQINNLLQYWTLQLLPVIVAIGTIRTYNDLKLVLYIFIICFSICSLYGITCFIFRMPYPYNEWFGKFFSVARNADYERAVENVMGGIQGRIIGTSTSDSWSFGMVITSVFMITYFIHTYLKNKYSLICCILCGIAVLFTVRRSPVLTFMAFFLFLSILYYRNIGKIAIYATLGLLAGVVIIVVIPELSAFRHIVESSMFFWDDSVSASNGVSGSSVSLRIYQLNYTVSHIADSFLFGNGWGAMYVKYHPRMFGWESIVFTTLFQSGFLGLIMMVLLYYYFYRYSIVNMENKGIAKAFVLASAIFAVFTDTIYPFYTYFGCVLLHKLNRMANTKKQSYCAFKKG